MKQLKILKYWIALEQIKHNLQKTVETSIFQIKYMYFCVNNKNEIFFSVLP
jgi:hypothetical protein